MQYAPEYPRGSAVISFFGVYRDGRVNDDAWDALGTRFSSSIGGAPCEVLYGTSLVTHDPDLTGAIDSYARASGVTEDLLGRIAPMAKGDLVAVFSISGHPPQPLPERGGPSAPGGSANYAGGGGKHGGGGMTNGGMGGGLTGGGHRESAPPTDNDVFEISATLYSVKAKRTVGVVAMAYTGSSVDDALGKFTERFQSEMSGARCVGWSWDKRVDPATIRQGVDR